MKILFLSPWFPYPPVNGSKARIYHLIKALSPEHTLDLVAFIRPGEMVDPAGLHGLVNSIKTVPWKEFRPQSPRAFAGFFSLTPRSFVDSYNLDFQRQVQRALVENQPDIVIASELWTAPYIQSTEHLPVILDDIEFAEIHDHWKSARPPTSRLRTGLTWVKTSRYLQKIIQRYTFCTVVSSYEQTLLQTNDHRQARVYVVPNGVDLEQFRLGLAEPQPGKLIYPGSLTFQANYDAIRFFLSEIYPTVEQAHPEVKLWITGSYENVDISNLMLRPSVTLTGFLDDVRPAIAAASLCVVPVRQGSGTRVKILEALALGTPVLTTTKGMQGLDLMPEEHLLVADHPLDFANQVVRLMNNPDLRARLASAGRKRVEALYDWNSIGAAFLDLVNLLKPAEER